jgi:HAD superfamily hydrolase (TIGR01490 family)
VEKSIAFFDFDGTITTKDTMLELARFSRGNDLRYLIGLCIVSPWVIAMKLGLVSKTKAKEKLLTHFFAGKTQDAFDNLCQRFSAEKLPQLIKKDAFAVISDFTEKSIPVVIVSASAENWVAPWCKDNDLQFICTKLMVKDNRITGELKGENCNGNEKVCRIKASFNLADYSTIYCYGDTSGDKLMLELATHKHYRHFKK